MRIFVTGATGFIGTAVVPELIQAGHSVLGLTRSDAGAEALKTAGADVLRGDLTDLASLESGAAQADAVIHLAFNHDFSQFVKNCEMDRNALTALAKGLASSPRPTDPEHGRPFLMTSGTGIVSPGQVSTEDDAPPQSDAMPRGLSELLVADLATQYKDKGLRAGIVRLPQVHDPYKAGLVTYLIAIARQTQTLAYVGDGSNRWPAAHISDVARLYRLALERKGLENGSTVRYHAVGEQGVTQKDIIESVSRGLKLTPISVTKEKAAELMGFLGHFAALDLQSSSAQTQKWLNWHPTGPTLLEDLDKGLY
jgi:nucleoside-diphosphate-sugar epimerase